MNVKKELFDQEVKNAVTTLKKGGVILCPTDTIWGISCDATNEKAANKVYAIKARPKDKSFIILVNDEEMLLNYVDKIDPVLHDVLQSYKEPLTIVYEKGKNLPKNVLAADGSIAIRVVKNDFCIELIKQLGKPIISTSANISGIKTPHKYADVSETILEKIDYVVHQQLESHTVAKASTMVKLNEHGDLHVLR